MVVCLVDLLWLVGFGWLVDWLVGLVWFGWLIGLVWFGLIDWLVLVDLVWLVGWFLVVGWSEKF